MSSKRRAKSSAVATALLQDWLAVEGPLLTAPRTTHDSESGQTLTFEKVRIDFPLKPYPAQVQMMRNIVHTLNNSENALLESPTGSGKSLALLCAALAWRENEEKKIAEDIVAKREDLETLAIEELKRMSELATKQLALNNSSNDQLSAIEVEPLKLTNIDQDTKTKVEANISTDLEKLNEIQDSIMSIETSNISVQTKELSNAIETTEIPNVSILKDISNIQDVISNTPVITDASGINPSTKREADDNNPSNWMKKFKCNDNNVITINEDSFDDFQFTKKPVTNEDNISPPNETDPVHTLKYQTFKKLPRIYVGSRTHKQITQLISELKNKTRYNPRTTILASREQLCIHPKVSKAANKTEGCIELLDKKGCMFKHRTTSIINDPAIKVTNKVWDIEDIVKIGRKNKGCPFYASRKLFDHAEVIFCPYNYIIDPVIRSIMDINLKGNIVILDEAHNIEDAARSAGSFEVDETTLTIVRKELNQIIINGFEKEAHQHLELVVEQMFDWITSENNVYSIKEYESHHCNWTGENILRKLEEASITANIFHNILTPAFKTAKAHADEIRKESESDFHEDNPNEEVSASQAQFTFRKCLSNNSLTVLQGVFMVFGFLFREGKNYVEDYQMILTKRIERSGGRQNQSAKKRRKKDMEPEWTFKLGFTCLNPGIIFTDMSEETKSVVLTSGTLSPLNTFASELETKFEARLEANHVIDKSQVWVGAIPTGPNGVTLKGVYKNWESFQYQDDIGESLCTITEKVPFGVLCFLPSYNSLDKLLERWKLTGLYDRLCSKKVIYCEPRGSDKKEFEDTIGSFYQQIDTVKDGPDELGHDGALFFAVFRGKVSEGIDFTDNYCRAVVTVGIPYPSIKDIEVSFKKEYNDKKKNRVGSKDRLSGSDWYSAQAFRAINQALGRCIRHKNDWGAIILLEDRFRTNINISNLSKWVRNQLKVHNNFNESMSYLSDFVQIQLERTTISPPSLPITVATKTIPDMNDENKLASAQYIAEVSQPLVKEEPLSDKLCITPNLETSMYWPPSEPSLMATPSNQAISDQSTETSNNPNQTMEPINKDTQHKKELDNEFSFNDSIFSEPNSLHDPIYIDSDEENFFPNETIVPNESKIMNEHLEKSIQHEITTKKPVNIPISQESNVFDNIEKPIVKQESEIPPRIMNPILQQESSRHSVETTTRQEPERLFKAVEPTIRQEPEGFDDPSEKTIKQESFQRTTDPNNVPISLVRTDFCSIPRNDTTHVCISCTWCGSVLLEGPTRYVQPTTIFDLKVILDNPNIDPKDIVQLNEPRTWKASDCFLGGPLDINQWPTESAVTFHKDDSICYRWLTCKCNVGRTTGIIIRQISNLKHSKYRGKAFLWLNQLCIQKVKKKSNASGVNSSVDKENETVSTQAANMNDLFYHL